ncbi:MAG TPA: ABC transporter ATP-binding protein, partial [Oscillospiraceae bacterium]|nr:ABC transporter ATP-binding protein [Oscillospiraceae bacterium]
MMRGPRRNQFMMSNTKEKHTFEETWGKLLSYSKPFYPVVIIALFSAIGGAIFTIIGPDRLSAMTDIITEGLMTGIDMKAVRNIAFTLAGFYAASVSLSFIQSFIMATVTQKMSKSMRTDISN